jgi:hypothetical protein
MYVFEDAKYTVVKLYTIHSILFPYVFEDAEILFILGVVYINEIYKLHLLCAMKYFGRIWVIAPLIHNLDAIWM